MSILFKKTLGLLGLGLTTTLVSSSVVSCGTSLKYLMDRAVSTDVFKSIYTSNVTSWNTAYSMQAEDARIWANSFDTFLSTDQYGRIYGSLVESEYGEEQNTSDSNYSYVGDMKNEGQQWTYKTRPMTWVNYQGKIVDQDGKVSSDQTKTGEGKASVIDGVRQAAWFALNPKNGSDVASLWTSFIKGASDIQKNISKAQAEFEKSEKTPEDTAKLNAAIKEEKEKIWSNNSDEFGITVSETTPELLTFDLTKKAPYFESLLTYSVFSPIFTADKGDIKDFTQAMYNASYYPTQANPNGKIILQKNEHYVLKDSTKINTLEFNYVDDASATKERILFESGSTTGFELKSDDLKGWKNYIGQGKEAYENPNFEGAYPIVSPDASGSFLLVYNFYNSEIDDNSLKPDDRDRALDASKLLQSIDARTFLSTALDRTDFVRYFSKTIDEVGQPSQMLRNTYTGYGVASNGAKDYTQYVSDSYDEIIKSNGGSVTSSDADWSLKDGKDPYFNKSKDLTNKNNDELIKNINEYITLNNIKKRKVKGKSEEKVILKLILSPSNNNSLNPYLNMMFKKFNEIKNNPIFVQTKVLSSTDEYRTNGSRGATDLFVSGWSPDYKDPSSFLETMTLWGPYGAYNGTSRLFKSKVSAVETNEVEGSDYNITTDRLYAKSLDNPSDENSATKDVLKAYETYSNDFQKTDLEVAESNQRFSEFAETETQLLYKDFLTLTLYTKAMPTVWTVNYLTPYTKSYEAFGTGQYKYYNVTINSKILGREQWKAAYKAYQDWKTIIAEDWYRNRHGAHWKEQTD
ncbi:ABC transporter substrate-binding protein [Spiroplasma cantharicola]|uniref:Oligopeptide ABC transporter substrate-binding protein n=1 Tax=Spiroplasma cantharicola TaxID=362837 RepID=A0A0M5KCF3_9MOLU|nr:ABC transporter substrate-binding protein [Spiroplasma cantharicola]ALD66676.1 oligopeptide ABC transporter substrate-binding protein [Spiroplasma cantharicola]